MLKLCDIVKNYPSATTTVHALRGVSLSFREHEFVSILGPSGCGKTTLLNIIGGLDRYTDGDLIIGGVSTASFDDMHWDAYRNATIGFVFQSYNLIPHLTVLENVELALSLVGEKKRVRRAKAIEALRKVGIEGEINKRPNQLSGGQMQRVAIARAIVNDPKIILADEPTGALDSELSVQVMDILREISATRLVIMVTHNAELAKEYSTRICRFKDGQLIEDTNPYEYDGGTDIFDDSAIEDSGNSQTHEVGGGTDIFDDSQIEDNSNNQRDEVPEVGGGTDLTDDITTEDGSNNQWDEASETENNIKADDNNQTDSCTCAESNNQRDEIPGIITADVTSLKDDVHVVESADEVDYAELAVDEENKKTHKVSNHKRKKQMKHLHADRLEVFDRLGLNSLSKPTKKRKKRDSSFKPTSMSAGMAFGLSIRNLISKKRRTFLTAFAGSIGIIGLGLVLSISNGFDVFVNDMQTEMLAGVPVGVYEYNVEASAVMDVMSNLSMSNNKDDAYPDTDKITVSQGTGGGGMAGTNEILNAFFKSVSKNDLNEEFSQYINDMPAEYYSAKSAYYGLQYNLIAKTDSGEYEDVSQKPKESDVMTIATSILGESGMQPTYWQVLVGGEKNMLASYDLIGENSRYPKNKNELLLCIGENNTVDEALLKEFGISVDGLDPEQINADFFIGRTLKLIANNNYYVNDPENRLLFYQPLEDQQTLKAMYDGSSEELKIVGVIRSKKEAKATYVSGAVCYTPELAEYVLENSYNSDIAKAQREIMETPDLPYNTVFGEKKTDDDLASGSGIIGVLGKKLYFTSFIKSIGATKAPTYINFYPATYDQKLSIGKYIADWNKMDKGSIGYFDVSEMFIYNLNMIIDLVSAMLVAVASISLVVSTVMIGVITSNSVIERTREIGILRALGARKRDIRSVFIAETSLIGLAGGLIGIILTYIMCPIISAIIGATVGVQSLLHFHPLHALLLVALSLVLTVLSGILPAIGASRKNVVDALRVD